jgi:hypothetical protein
VRAFAAALGRRGWPTGELARLLALDPRVAIDERVQLGVELVNGLRERGEEHRAAQAAMHAADALLLLQDDARAAGILALTSIGWRELGDLGWKLRSLGCVDPQRVRQLVAGGTAAVRVYLFGRPRVVAAGTIVPLSRRLAECVAVLVMHPEGCSAARLAALMDGDSGGESTMKGLIRRLRGLLRVQSRPYRLDPSVWVDLRECLDALRAGALSDALAHYAGSLVPESDGAFVRELRLEVEESLRRAAMATQSAGDALLLIDHGGEEDLELLEHAASLLPSNSPQSHRLQGRIERVRRDWGME